MVASESATSASKVETWAQGILSYLEEARNTLKTVSFDEESEMAYLKTSLNRNESYPNGIYIGESSGNYIDPSGWVPDADYDFRSRKWYQEGIDNETFTFGAAYLDDVSEEYVACNQSILDTVDRLGEHCSEADIAHLKDIFKTCSRFEAFFWDMAWNMTL